jgi:hypothetical protein
LGFRIANAALFRIEDGKVVDEWPRTDMLGLTQGIEKPVSHIHRW